MDVVLIGGGEFEWKDAPDVSVAACNYHFMKEGFPRVDWLYIPAAKARGIDFGGRIYFREDLVDERLWYRKFGIEPTIGFLALRHLLSLGLEVFVTGFNFYGWRVGSVGKIHGGLLAHHLDAFTWLFERSHRITVDERIRHLMSQRLLERIDHLYED